MFKIDSNKYIHITRGDAAFLEIHTTNDDNTIYEFQTGDVVRFKVFKRKDCGCVEIQKDVVIDAPTQAALIELTKEDTKIGDLINKPSKYWYEVELNPETKPQTIIGYDEDGEKLFILYPEGDER